MRLFIALSFAALAVLYWAVSGGSGFVPEAWPRQTASTGGTANASEGVSEGVSDVAVTRAEPPTSDPVTPPPEPAALTPEPAVTAVEAAVVTAAAPESAESQAAAPEPTAGPEGLPETPVEPDEALAALAPDLADAPPDAAPASPVEAAAPAPPARREVTGDRVNLREGPGTTFDVVGRLARGEAAEVIELRDGWARVRVGANEGWMSERFLAP